MKTGSENANRNVGIDKKVNKKGTRKFLQTLQPSGDKENLVGTGRFPESTDTKTLKAPTKVAVAESNFNENKSLLAKVNPSLYQKLIIEDLTSSAGPSEKYWEVIAERRRKALEDVLEQNRKLHNLVIALEEENASCKVLLEQTTDVVNTLKEILSEARDENEDDEDDENLIKSDVDDKDDTEENLESETINDDDDTSDSE